MKYTQVNRDNFSDWHPEIEMAYENGISLKAKLDFDTSLITYIVIKRRQCRPTIITEYTSLVSAISEYNESIEESKYYG